MLDEYYIIKKSALPEIYLKVLETKDLLQNGICDNISQATKRTGISRSAFYKYQNVIFTAGEALSHKAVISFMLDDKRGLLSEVLSIFSQANCNILTINQNIPLQKKANVVVSIDMVDSNSTIEQIIQQIKEVKGLTKAQLVAIE